MSQPIALLTDFGRRDVYVGAMKGAILCRNPSAQLVDLTHDVPPGDIRQGAFVLAASVQHFPPGTVFLAVVDPGVGTARRGLAVEAADWLLVGPDNGLLAWALRFLAWDGRVAFHSETKMIRPGSGWRAVELAERRFWRSTVSGTFHGRDIFGPVAAELSLGRGLDELGPVVDRIVDLAWPEPRRTASGALAGEVVVSDHYGNLITNLRQADLPPLPEIEIGGRVVRGLAEHFQSSAPLVALIGSSGFVELAAPNGSAAAMLSAGEGTPVVVRAGKRS